MSEQQITVMALAAGLEKVLAEFADDVAIAAREAFANAAKIEAPTDPAAEPWPSMRAGTAWSA